MHWLYFTVRDVFSVFPIPHAASGMKRNVAIRGMSRSCKVDLTRERGVRLLRVARIKSRPQE